jgi:hypothetical protein
VGQYTDLQDSGSREKTSLSKRSPVDNPAFASSPTISAAEATSSAAPGGCTGPLAASPSHSKPCLGAASRVEIRRLGADVFRRADAPPRTDLRGRSVVLSAGSPASGRAAAGRSAPARAGPAPAVCVGGADFCPRLGGAPSAPERPPALVRAATRRRLARCGRVRGRLARTPCSSCWAFEEPSLELASVTRHIIA